MRPRPLETVAELAGARLLPGESGALVLVGPEVVIDSRLASPGSLFVALPGEHVDGRDFIKAAAEAGAAAALTTTPTDAPIAHLIVDDPVAALSRLAQAIVGEGRQAGLKTVAITGSSGKTSTKDLLAQVLESTGSTVAPKGSFNNEIGVPLTATGVDDDTKFLVSEMGARGRGHISALTELVPPDVAVVLNVGTAHLGEFGSVEAIAESKAELVAGLGVTDWAVLNADDPRVAEMASVTGGQVAWFSAGSPVVPIAAPLVVTAEDVQADDLQRHQFTMVVVQQGQTSRHPVQLPVIGAHQVSNACAAAAAAIALGVPAASVADALTTVVPRSRWRMELHVRADQVAVLNDAYNANPDSMAAALDALAGMIGARRQRFPRARAVAVLGDMLELGPESVTLHRNLGERAVRAGADEVVAVGAWAEEVVAGARAAGGSARVALREEVVASLPLVPGDIVLVKGSRGVALERVADELLTAPGGAA